MVDARVMGLSQRGWLQEEQLADLISVHGQSRDLEEERKSIRARLLRELSLESRELLLRLSLLVSNFDRAIPRLSENPRESACQPTRGRLCCIHDPPPIP